jgi:hypothetical protein
MCFIWLSCRMSTKCVYVFRLTLLQDIYKMCSCVPVDYSAGYPQSVFICSTWLSCRMFTKCVYVFQLTLLKDNHNVCFCVSLDYPAGCLQNLFVCSIWLSWRMSTECVYVFHATLLHDVHEVCLCVPLDFPAGYPQCVFMCSTWLSCRMLQNVFMCSTWLSCRMSTKCVYVFHMTLLQNVDIEYLCVLYYCHNVQPSVPCAEFADCLRKCRWKWSFSDRRSFHTIRSDYTITQHLYYVARLRIQTETLKVFCTSGIKYLKKTNIWKRRGDAWQ